MLFVYLNNQFWKIFNNEIFTKETLVDYIEQYTLIKKENFFVQVNNKFVDAGQILNGKVNIFFKLLGGKKGFENQLRKKAIHMKRFNNCDYAKDENGRFIKDVRNEIEMRKLLEEQEQQNKKQEKLEKKQKIDKNEDEFLQQLKKDENMIKISLQKQKDTKKQQEIQKKEIQPKKEFNLQRLKQKIQSKKKQFNQIFRNTSKNQNQKYNIFFLLLKIATIQQKDNLNQLQSLLSLTKLFLYCFFQLINSLQQFLKYLYGSLFILLFLF